MIVGKMTNMTKEEWIEKNNNIKNPIIEKYGIMEYYVINDVFNINFMEDICISLGYTTKRCNIEFTIYSKLFDENSKEIGIISNQGCPSIEIYKRNKKHAIKISKNENVISPIEGIHRILDWHTVEGKLHKLAGGEIVLHFKPLEISDKEIQTFNEKTKILELIKIMEKKNDNVVN